MKYVLIVISILGFHPVLFGQSGQQKLKLLELISSIENEYDTLKSNPSSIFFIQSSGMILEKDTMDHFEVSFSLIDIDITQLKVIDDSSLQSDALSFYCKNNEQCIHVKDGTRKPRYHRSFEGFYVEFENKAQSDSIVFKFSSLQKLLLK
ncbi:MAG: hypothetical protein IT219_05940 [Bacteroidales bacterium]|nr:hypothetical protein [Bacteroidales bacterium]